MENFTPLVEKLGHEEAFTLMDRVYEILIHKVHEFEGTVNDLTGDGMMALFGAPIALEDAPQRAIRSALAIHREITQFSDRMKQEKGIPAIRIRKAGRKETRENTTVNSFHSSKISVKEGEWRGGT